MGRKSEFLFGDWGKIGVLSDEFRKKEMNMKFGKRHYRPQVDQMDCGVASLAMVLATMVAIILCSLTRIGKDDHGWDDGLGLGQGGRGDWL